MNINQDPLRRPDSQRPPTAAERAAMEETRRHVQRANVEGEQVVRERTESARVEARSREDRIEISVRARRDVAAHEAKVDRQAKVENLRKLYKSGRIHSPERARAAAENMLKRMD